MKLSIIPFVLSCLSVLSALPAFALDGCVSSEVKDNKIGKVSDLVTGYKSDISGAKSFEDLLKVNEKYSGCPEHEPGTDSYQVFSNIQVTPVAGKFIKIRFDVIGSVTDSDGNHHWVFNKKNEFKTFKYTVFKTDKGFRFGEKQTGLLLENGLFLNKVAAKEHFKLSNF